jgi:hypothetical protein
VACWYFIYFYLQFVNNTVTEQVHVAVLLYASIQVVLCLNLSQDNGYGRFSSVRMGRLWESSSGQNCFLPKSFQFIIYKSCYHLLLHSLDTDSITKYITKNQCQ